MSIEDTYKKETGKEPKDPKRKGFFTDEYVAWLKEYVKRGDTLATELYKNWVDKLLSHKK